MAGEVCYNNKRRSLKPVVPEVLLNPTALWKWENDNIGLPLYFQVDPEGFYLSARCERDKEAQYWDLCQISDVRIAEASSHLRDKLLWTERGDRDDDEFANSILQLVYRKDGIASLEFITLVAKNADIANNFMVALNSLTHNLYQLNCTMCRMVTKMREKLCNHANGHGELLLKMIDKIFTGKSDSRLESIEFSLEIAKVPVLENAHGRYIEVQHLTVSIVEDMISRVANTKDHVQPVFQGCKVPNMNEYKLVKFLNEVQRDPRDNEVVIEYHKTDKALSIIHNLEPMGREIGKITPVGMWRYLANNESNIVDLPQLGLFHDMTKPLSHYFINSSHNTYCNGAQFNGLSSVEIYRQCLLLGCRCVELDCWIQNDDIIITHGVVNGLWVCTTISFEKVLWAIKDFAFVTSDYPLILSIENHVDKPHLLRRMATLYQTIFGDRLLKEPVEGYPIEPGAQLPSPEMLRGKILLKDKIRIKKTKEGKENRMQLDDKAISTTTIEEEDEQKSNAESMPTSPDHASVRSPSVVSSGVATDTIDKVPSLSDSGTISLSNEDANGEEDADKKSNASKGSAEIELKEKGHRPLRSRGSITISVRLSSGGSTSSLGKDLPHTQKPRTSVTSEGSTSEVPCITIDESSPDLHTQESTSSVCELLPENVDEWPEHVNYELEPNWIVVDDMTLKRSPKKKHGVNMLKNPLVLTHSCPPGDLKEELDLNESTNSLLMSSGSTKSDGQVVQSAFQNLSLPPNYLPRAASEGMALVGGPIVELLNYCTAVKFESFEAAEKLDHSNHVSSMDEEKAMQNLLEYPIEFVKYNARQFSRIYPAGKRINSSNYPPHLYWDAGCQMVALNFQTSDLAMQLNCAKFEQNLNCGYLLKPPVLRNALATPFNIFEHQKFENIVPSKITLKILSGLFLSERQNMVDIDIFGLPVDCTRRGHHKTRYQGGPHPKWENPNEEFLFEKIILPDLALLRFCVTDDKGDLVGQRVLPLSMIRSGYRFVTLRDKHSQPLLLSSLFVLIKIENYVPEDMKVIVDVLTNPNSSRKWTEVGRASPGLLPGHQSFSSKNNPLCDTPPMSSPALLRKTDQLLPSMIPVEDQIPSEVRNRHMPAIKHDDVVVRNSQRMSKYFKKEEKERTKLQGGYNSRLSQMKEKHDRTLKKYKSVDSLKGFTEDYEKERNEVMSTHHQEMQHLELRLIEERYRETAMVLSKFHEEQMRKLCKQQDKEAEKYQKLIVQVYSNQISTKLKDRIGEATIKHQRIEVSRKCTEKIQELKALHAKEVDTLMSSQQKLQEQLQSDRDKELNNYKKTLPRGTSTKSTSSVSDGVVVNSNGNNNSNHDDQTGELLQYVWDF